MIPTKDFPGLLSLFASPRSFNNPRLLLGWAPINQAINGDYRLHCYVPTALNFCVLSDYRPDSASLLPPTFMGLRNGEDSPQLRANEAFNAD